MALVTALINSTTPLAVATAVAVVFWEIPSLSKCRRQRQETVAAVLVVEATAHDRARLHTSF